MRVLIVGQLPKEAGGTYTTGIARVIENLYQKNFGGPEIYWYFTNVIDKVAQEKCKYKDQYHGYRIIPFCMLWGCIRHPINTFKEWNHYKRIDNVNPIRYDFYKHNFLKVIENVQPDLIHLHGAGMSPLYYATKGKGKKVVLTYHGVMYNENDKSSWHFKPLYQSCMQMADYFTVLNQETKRKALGLGMPSDRYAIIPNGVDTSHYYFSLDQRDILRKQFQVNPDCRVFLTTGLVINRKGQYDFIKELESLNIDYQYWIVGKGPDEQKINKYIAENGLEKKVKLLGYVVGTELYKYLSAADVYAHVSTTEGQALSEIEAYATGLKILVRKEIAGTVIGDSHNDRRYFVLDMSSQNLSDKTELEKWIDIDLKRTAITGRIDWRDVALLYGNYYSNILNSIIK